MQQRAAVRPRLELDGEQQVACFEAAFSLRPEDALDQHHLLGDHLRHRCGVAAERPVHRDDHALDALGRFAEAEVARLQIGLTDDGPHLGPHRRDLQRLLAALAGHVERHTNARLLGEQQPREALLDELVVRRV